MPITTFRSALIASLQLLYVALTNADIAHRDLQYAAAREAVENLLRQPLREVVGDVLRQELATILRSLPTELPDNNPLVHAVTVQQCTYALLVLVAPYILRVEEGR